MFYCLGGNFLRTLPEPERVREALTHVPLRVHQDIIITDQMFIVAKNEVILLPAKTRYEQDDGGIETTTERRIAFSPEIPRQVGEARAEWKILRNLVTAVHPARAHLLGCETGWKMREEIVRIVPFYEGTQRLKNTGDAVQYGGPHLCADWKFATSDGKAHFRAVELPRVDSEQSRVRHSVRAALATDHGAHGVMRPTMRTAVKPFGLVFLSHGCFCGLVWPGRGGCRSLLPRLRG